MVHRVSKELVVAVVARHRGEAARGLLDWSQQDLADAREPLMAWYRQVRGADWATPADVKRAIGSASILNDGRAVVVWINYPYRVVYVRSIGTHRQYDKIDAQTV